MHHRKTEHENEKIVFGVIAALASLGHHQFELRKFLHTFGAPLTLLRGRVHYFHRNRLTGSYAELERILERAVIHFHYLDIGEIRRGKPKITFRMHSETIRRLMDEVQNDDLLLEAATAWHAEYSKKIRR